jgi:hypothetical protein
VFCFPQKALDDEEQTRSDLRQLFNKFDVDRDGYWSRSEFRQFKQSLRSLMQTGPIVMRVVVAVIVVLITLLISGFCYLRSFFAAPTKAVAAALAADAPSRRQRCFWRRRHSTTVRLKSFALCDKRPSLHPRRSFFRATRSARALAAPCWSAVGRTPPMSPAKRSAPTARSAKSTTFSPKSS